MTPARRTAFRQALEALRAELLAGGAAKIEPNRRDATAVGVSDEDEQAWTWVIRSFEGRLGLQMDTLRRFNEKFRPRWVPRHIAFRSPVDLPAIALATLSAEGFLPFDSGRSPAPTVRA